MDAVSILKVATFVRLANFPLYCTVQQKDITMAANSASVTLDRAYFDTLLRRYVGPLIVLQSRDLQWLSAWAAVACLSASPIITEFTELFG